MLSSSSYFTVVMVETTSNWSDLPQDLLELILKLLTLPDQIRFTRVCRWWKAVTIHYRARQAPLLILRRKLTHSSRETDNIRIRLFSLPEKIMETTLVPLFCPESIISSSGGWILLQDTRNSHIKFLFNPFTLTRVALPEAEETVYYHDCLFFSTRDNPSGALLVTKSHNKFLLCRLNDQPNGTCHQVEWETTSFVSNVIFFQGKLHALNEDRSLVVLADPPLATSEVKMEMNLQISALPQWNRRDRYHLVESREQLLLVRVIVVSTSPSVEVFGADLTKCEWTEIEHLDTRALFLSPNGSVCVHASASGCKANRIYYAPSTLEWNLYLYQQSNGTRGTYVEFELGKDGLDIPSIPGCDDVIGCDWLT